MTLSESFLSNAAWLFFTAWSLIVAVVTIKAFGRDLLPSKKRPDSAQRPFPPDAVAPLKTQSH
jgi:hypothetical protein